MLSGYTMIDPFANIGRGFEEAADIAIKKDAENRALAAQRMAEDRQNAAAINRMREEDRLRREQAVALQKMQEQAAVRELDRQQQFEYDKMFGSLTPEQQFQLESSGGDIGTRMGLIKKFRDEEGLAQDIAKHRSAITGLGGTFTPYDPNEDYDGDGNPGTPLDKRTYASTLGPQALIAETSFKNKQALELSKQQELQKMSLKSEQESRSLMGLASYYGVPKEEVALFENRLKEAVATGDPYAVEKIKGELSYITDEAKLAKTQKRNDFLGSIKAGEYNKVLSTITAERETLQNQIDNYNVETAEIGAAGPEKLQERMNDLLEMEVGIISEIMKGEDADSVLRGLGKERIVTDFRNSKAVVDTLEDKAARGDILAVQRLPQAKKNMVDKWESLPDDLKTRLESSKPKEGKGEDVGGVTPKGGAEAQRISKEESEVAKALQNISGYIGSADKESTPLGSGMKTLKDSANPLIPRFIGRRYEGAPLPFFENPIDWAANTKAIDKREEALAKFYGVDPSVLKSVSELEQIATDPNFGVDFYKSPADKRTQQLEAAKMLEQIFSSLQQ